MAGPSRLMLGELTGQVGFGLLLLRTASDAQLIAEKIEPKHGVHGFHSVKYRIGQTVGLPIGGLLSNRKDAGGDCHNEFWSMYPFALPCFVGAGFGFLRRDLWIIFAPEVKSWFA